MLNTHLTLFFDYLKHEKKVSGHTLVAYKNDLEQFITFLDFDLETISITEINYQHIRAWITHLSNQKNTSQTINRKLSTLKSLYRFLMKQEIVTINPMSKINGPKNSKRLPVFIDEQQMEVLFNEIKFDEGFIGIRDKFILDLLYQTGLRRSELTHLTHSNTNLLASTIKVNGKGNKERILPISFSLKCNLDAYLKVKEELNLQNMMLLVNEKGNALTENALYVIVKKHLSQITTLQKKSPHVLRHTFATHLLNNGASILAVKDLLGHSSLNATQIYTHNTIENLKKSYKKAHPRGDS